MKHVCRVTGPRRECMLAVMASRPAPLTRPDGSPVRALIVDDEANLSDLLRMALENEGWDARTAANGQEALGAIRSSPPTCSCSTS